MASKTWSITTNKTIYHFLKQEAKLQDKKLNKLIEEIFVEYKRSIPKGKIYPKKKDPIAKSRW
jgi:hypothetical protein